MKILLVNIDSHFIINLSSTFFSKNMPQLTPQQKVIICSWLQDGTFIRDIAEELGVNKNTLLLTKQKIARHGTIIRKAGSGPPKISTKDQDRRLLNYLKDHPFETAIKAKEETNFSGSAPFKV